ncbi:MAG: TonB-dependent receptor [Alphaproteobacteria bacterium]|nr:TonB-dependent receptor [Alphaproteobacteria bacterium]
MASAVFCAATGATTGVANAQPAADKKVEKVTVTGSRIKRPGATSSSPTVTVGSDELRLRLTNGLQEVVQQLPGARPEQGPNVNNGQTGIARVDLRGMGPQRSLVLVNGRRVQPSDLNSIVDINQVPLAMVDRIDVITGGASSVYGADAVAGVVNFILKKNFEGVEVAAAATTTDRGDGNIYRVDGTMGASFDGGKGNVAISLGYYNRQPIFQGNRPLGQVSISSQTGAFQGSDLTFPTVIGNAPVRIVNPLTGTLDPYVTGGPQSYNFNPVNLYQTQGERYSLFGAGHYDISPSVHAYFEAMFSQNVQNTVQAPAPVNNALSFSANSPFMSASIRDELCLLAGIPLGAGVGQCANAATPPTITGIQVQRRLLEMGNRLANLEVNSYNMTAGLNGEFGGLLSGWEWDAYLTHGNSKRTTVTSGGAALSRLQQGLLLTPAGNACQNPANGCVPINLFGGPGSITAPMANFLSLGTISGDQIIQDVFNMSFTGDLGWFKSPLAGEGIDLALGAEYRSIKARIFADQAAQIAGEIIGGGAPTVPFSGYQDFYEVFAESYVPLIDDTTLIKSLGLELGYRVAASENQYTTPAGVHFLSNPGLTRSYKLGVDWKPFEDLRLRGMLQRALRAPNANELFSPVTTGLSNLVTDPCQLALPVGNPALTLLCTQTGAPPATIGAIPAPIAGQINNTGGGNPNLAPEKADTRTVGFVYQPSWFKNFYVSVDYFDIKVKDAISSASAVTIMNGCFSPVQNPAQTFNAFCALIQRNAITGSLNGGGGVPKGVTTASSNLGRIQTKGYEFAADYRFDLDDVGLDGWGSMRLGFLGEKWESWKFQSDPLSPNRECVTFYSTACTAPRPEWKWDQRTTWSMGDLDLSVRWRHISSVVVEPLPNGPNPATIFPAFRSIPTYDYFDVSAQYEVLPELTVSALVTNVFDKDAPNVGNTIGSTATNLGNTFPATYDAAGRYLTLGVNVKY